MNPRGQKTKLSDLTRNYFKKSNNVRDILLLEKIKPLQVGHFPQSNTSNLRRTLPCKFSKIDPDLSQTLSQTLSQCDHHS
jgi:hypothetical protein